MKQFLSILLFLAIAQMAPMSPALAQLSQPPATVPARTPGAVPPRDFVGPPAPTSAWPVFDLELQTYTFQSGAAVFELLPDATLAPLYLREPDATFSVGTAAMLFVQLTLAEAAAAGAITMTQPLAYDPLLKSFPATSRARFTEGGELPIAEWSRRMLFETNNTAAEHLFAILGRERIEAVRQDVRTRAEQAALVSGGAAAAPLPPFLSTIEFYKLKCDEAGVMLKQYAQADTAERYQLLAAELPTASVSDLILANWNKPQFIEQVGWHASPRELCVAMADLKALAQTPGVGQALDAALIPNPGGKDGPWLTLRSVLGGEPGVLAGVWLMERRDGRSFVAAVAFNDARNVLPQYQLGQTLRLLVEIVARVP